MDSVLRERLLVNGSRICRVFIGIIFLIAGLSKMAELYSFTTQVSLLTRSLVGEGFGTVIPTLLAFILPSVEVILGVSLIINLRPEITTRISIGFLMMFVGITFWLWVKGVSLECGCFGSLISRCPCEAMIEDIVMLSIAILGLFRIETQVLKSRFEWKIYLVLGVGLGILAINSICLVCFG